VKEVQFGILQVYLRLYRGLDIQSRLFRLISRARRGNSRAT
jgi:hypothetical protein